MLTFTKEQFMNEIDSRFRMTTISSLFDVRTTLLDMNNILYSMNVYKTYHEYNEMHNYIFAMCDVWHARKTI